MASETSPPRIVLGILRTLLGTLLAVLALAPVAFAQTQPGEIAFTMPTLPRIDGCNAPGGLVRIQQSDEPGSSPFWCGTPPSCLTVNSFDGTTYPCTITQYARRNPKYSPTGAPGANGITNSDLICSGGQNNGANPNAGVCPPVTAPPPPPPITPVSQTCNGYDLYNVMSDGSQQLVQQWSSSCGSPVPSSLNGKNLSSTWKYFQPSKPYFLPGNWRGLNTGNIQLNGCSVPNTATSINQVLHPGVSVSDLSYYSVTWICGATPARAQLNVCGGTTNGTGTSQACL